MPLLLSHMKQKTGPEPGWLARVRPLSWHHPTCTSRSSYCWARKSPCHPQCHPKAMVQAWDCKMSILPTITLATEEKEEQFSKSHLGCTKTGRGQGYGPYPFHARSITILTCCGFQTLRKCLYSNENNENWLSHHVICSGKADADLRIAGSNSPSWVRFTFPSPVFMSSIC